MTIELKGEKDLMRAIQKRYGKSAMIKITDIALLKGARKVVAIIKKEMTSFADTGASVEETSISKPMTIDGVRTVKIHWQGPRQRYRLIHLNEYGHYSRSGDWVDTNGKGVIENAMRQGRDVYFNTVKDEIRKRA